MVKSDSNPIFHVISLSRAYLAQFGNIELVPFPNISISYPMKINYRYTCNLDFLPCLRNFETILMWE